MDSKNEVIKKKKIIIILLAVIMTLLIIIGVIGGLLIYKNSQKNKDNLSGDVNTLDIGNNVQKEEEEQNILNVELEGEPENQVNEQGENSENNNTNTTTKPKVVDAPYYIKVNYGANTVTVYKKDKHGKYNTPVKAFICSVGTSTPTSGVYSISDKYTWRLLVRKCIWTICM